MKVCVPPASAICFASIDGNDSFCPSRYKAPSLKPDVNEFPTDTNFEKSALPVETVMLFTSLSKSVLQLTNVKAEIAKADNIIFFIIFLIKMHCK